MDDPERLPQDVFRATLKEEQGRITAASAAERAALPIKQQGACSPQDLLQLLQDNYALRILDATSGTPMSTQAIAQQYGIPIAVAYRRVHDLEDAGLLAMVGRPFNEAHRRTGLFRSQVEWFKLEYAPGKNFSIRMALKERDPFAMEIRLKPTD